MSVCATCGRPRTGTAPFCAGCGTRFPVAGGAGEPAAPDAPLTTKAPETGSAETRWDTRVDIPGGGPGLSPMPPTQPGGPYPGPMPPGQAAFGPQPPSPRRGGSGLLIALVVVLVLAVGGGAFALVSALTSHKTTAQPPSQPTSGAPATPSSGGGSQTPTPSASASASASPSGPADTAVAVAPAAAGNAAAPQVQTLLEHYFAAINAHDYAAYSSLLDAQMRGQNSRSHFDSGYATTHDSAETLTGISGTGGASLAATVSFTSHQSPADSINNSSCTAWTITLYLEPQGGGSYLIGAPPAGYQPSHQDCP
jgi:hypothetical protein